MSPKVDIKAFEYGKDIQISVKMEIYPEVPEVDLNKVKITKRDAEITSSDIDESLTKLLKFYRKWNAKDAAYKAKMGDSVNIDYVGKIDKVEFELS